MSALVKEYYRDPKNAGGKKTVCLLYTSAQEAYGESLNIKPKRTAAKAVVL